MEEFLSMLQYFDTHSHLTDDAFDEDRPALLAELPQRGVAYVLDCATGPENWQKAANLSERYDYIYCALGVHPHEAGELPENWLIQLESLLKSTPKVRALGEIGLDYHYDFCPRELQKHVLDQQLELACKLNLPVVLHDREAHEDMMNALRPFKGRLKGVMHCYSGSAEMVREVLDLGLYLGFGGSMTFKNNKKTPVAAAVTPLDRILLETDCPYMTPVPYRGKRNDPSYVEISGAFLAAYLGMPEEELARITLENGRRLFSIHR